MEETNMFVNAYDLLKEELSTNPIITFSESLDTALGGGIFLKVMTEIYGGNGSGKTTFCLQLALNIQTPRSLGGHEAQCLYIDTENSFVPQRLKTMATKFEEHCQQFNVKVSAQSLIQGIHYFNCRSALELEELTESLDAYFLQHSTIRLIIIDSLAFLYYSISSDFEVRTKSLYTIAQNLRSLMNKYKLAVIVTNSMTTRFGKEGDEYHIPYLGESWSFVPNKRIHLELDGNSARTATVVKCSALKGGVGQFRITSAGIRDCSNINSK